MELLREELGVEASLVKGSNGIFEVKVDDRVVARKTWTGFPSDAEIVGGVEKALRGG